MDWSAPRRPEKRNQNRNRIAYQDRHRQKQTPITVPDRVRAQAAASGRAAKSWFRENYFQASGLMSPIAFSTIRRRDSVLNGFQMIR